MAEVDLLRYYPKSKRNVDERVERADAKVREISMQFGEDFGYLPAQRHSVRQGNEFRFGITV